MKRTVCILGLGYIGLPTAAVLASRGFTVHGVDTDSKKIDSINQGICPIVEPGLNDLLKKVAADGNLRADSKPKPADIFLIAVPTPFKENHKPDLSFIKAAALSIAPHLAPGNLVILESTSPVGTTEQLSAWLGRTDIHVAHCPERVLPGNILSELVQNDRIIGGLTSQATELSREFYQHFVTGVCLATDARTAEMAKLTENAFRDVNIAFANELSIICQKLNVDVWELIALANRHPRVNILNPGPGVGGHCIAVDPWFIVDSAPSEAKLIRTAREVNDHKPHHVLQTIHQIAQKLKNPVVALLGLSFKANVDDLRESPALAIAQQFAAEGVSTKILVVEPHISALPLALAQYKSIQLTTLGQALEHADVVVGLVDHDDFKQIQLASLKNKIVVDTRGMWKKTVS